jgi:serine/threonine protein kinase
MNDHDSSALTPGTRIDQYSISGLLGRGGFGITYLVRDEGLHRDFALKEFFPEGLVRREGTSVRFLPNPSSEGDYRWGLRKFYDEARLLAQFSHPNIISVRRVFEANNSAYMLLDFINGSTLEKWLQGLDSPPTQEELDLISAPLLSALEMVHANRTWHLDISPDNIMIRAADGEPILLDFGASRFELKQHSQLVSALVFKSGYSAPEQYTSNADRYGPWTDIYAFGATLYRALSGRRPSEATERQLEDDERPAALVGKGRYREPFLQAIDWALKIPPKARPQSIADWRKSLLEGSGVATPQTTRIRTDSTTAEPRASPSRPVRANRRIAAAFAIGVLGGAAVVAPLLPGAFRWLETPQNSRRQEVSADREDEVRNQAEAKRQADATAARKSLEEAQAKAEADAKRQREERRSAEEGARHDAAAKRQADAAAVQKSLEGAQAKAEADAKRQREERLAAERRTERQRMPNTAFIGDIIATESNRRSSIECRDACLSRAGCKAYEFRLSGAVCYLYRTVHRQHESTDAISGRWD